MPFVHLSLHTEYSLVDGIVRVRPLVEAVREAGMPAVAVTDHANLFAMVKFYRAAQAAGVKPIVGVDLRLQDREDAAQTHRLSLLCQSEAGYKNLTRLVSRAYTEGQVRGQATVCWDWLRGAGEGLIALSGGREGDVGRALLGGRPEQAEALLEDWRRAFPGRYYLEVSRTGRPGEEDHLHAAVVLAGATGMPVVAVNEVRFLAGDDFEAHEARVCIQAGRTLDDPRRERAYSEQQYLRGPEEMAELFADLPEALENSVEIARRCNLELHLGKYYLPDFPTPEGRPENAWFEDEVKAGLEARLAVLFDPRAPDFGARRRPYDERLGRELGVIVQMGFAGYFLIVADFIRWAKSNGVPVGPGRGSGAGSLVAYAQGITDLDPIAYDLLFERFLNPERVSMPDFDVDFCMEGRDRVIDYVAQRYGRDRVSQIITYGSMAAKAVVRDVGRVLGHPYGFVDKIAKLIPFDLKMTLDKALDEEPELARRYAEDEEVRALIDLARKLEGLARNAGRHAGGVVIAPSVLTDFAPLYCEPGASGVVTQFDKDDVEAVGLVKFDFLGLRTLTIIDWALATVNRGRAARDETPVDITRIPTEDRETFALIKRAETTAVFQLESRGMKDLIRRLQPDCFEDIIALVALFRPGPLQSGMVDDFINRKHGRARVEYPHPDLEPILQPTYGVILYQEQVMQIAQVLAGYTLGGADLLRRAMGKKKAEEMAKQRDIFVGGARERGVDEARATYIFDLMEKFAGYGFNKSHSAAYALVSYQTAWLKAHYPAAFMAAVLSADMDNTDKVVGLIQECRDLRLEVLPPCVNHSEHAFTVTGERGIRYGLGAIKGLGQSALDALIAEREEADTFADLYDFCRRIDARRLNRRALEAMIRAGALDALGPNRAALMAGLTRAMQAAEQHLRDVAAGQGDLFGGAAVARAVVIPGALEEVPEWPEEQRLAGEKETLGLYLTGHPVRRYRGDLAQLASGSIRRLLSNAGTPAGDGGHARARGPSVRVAGLVTQMRVRPVDGGRMAFLTLDDESGRLEVKVGARQYERFERFMAPDRVLVVEGRLGFDDFAGAYRLSADQVYDMDGAREAHAKTLLVRVHARQFGEGFIERLSSVIEPFREGPTPIRTVYRGAGVSCQLRLGERWQVRPTDELLHRLRGLVGEQEVEVRY